MRTAILLPAVGILAAAAGFFGGRMTAPTSSGGGPASGKTLEAGSEFTTSGGTLKVVLREAEHVLVRHGPWITRYPGGERRELAAYVDGVLDGPFTRWHADGQVSEQGEWRGGKKHSVWTQFNQAGVKTVESEFKDGVPVGTARSWDASGNLIAEQDLLERARAGGKYRDLIMRFEVRDDQQTYGDFKDFGYYRTTHYKGIENIPTGYWVYVFPYWHIWREKVEK